ncbi:nuclease domain-containing protein [Collimonas humicola]|uniref:nuclease domain-containing protein n=1 Tax=Collimonas humicola TaxID=2825886 RepID=UPI001B8C10CD|nr:nuclease domain-containing protein [Collimonas humicola]
MKRSPLKRTPFVRSKPAKRMRSTKKPLTKIQASARDEECTLRFPFGICNYRTDTTVLCHSNLLADGKGAGLKAPDTEAAYGCVDCHDVLDGRAPRPAGFSYELMLALFNDGRDQTRRILRRKNLLPAEVAQ